MNLTKNDFSIWLVLCVTLMIAPTAQADHFHRVDGVEVYTGIVRTAMMSSNLEMHGGAPRKENAFHITVALFDAESGNRITNATVHAELSPIGLEDARRRRLEPMAIADTVTYGEYFKMSQKTVYRLIVEVRLPDREDPIVTKFEIDRRKLGH